MESLCTKDQEPNDIIKNTVTFRRKYRGVLLENIKGDVYNEAVDAIISQANTKPTDNSGLTNSLRVHNDRQSIQEANYKTFHEDSVNLPTETSTITSAGHRVRKVVYVSCPSWIGGTMKEAEKLGEAVINALNKTSEIKPKSIAISSLSSGSFGFPKDLEAQIIITKIQEYIEIQSSSSVKCVKFVNFDSERVRYFESKLQGLDESKDNKDNLISYEEPDLDSRSPTADASMSSQLSSSARKPKADGVSPDAWTRCIKYSDLPREVVQQIVELYGHEPKNWIEWQLADGHYQRVQLRALLNDIAAKDGYYY